MSNLTTTTNTTCYAPISIGGPDIQEANCAISNTCANSTTIINTCCDSGQVHAYDYKGFNETASYPALYCVLVNQTVTDFFACANDQGVVARMGCAGEGRESAAGGRLELSAGWKGVLVMGLLLSVLGGL